MFATAAIVLFPCERKVLRLCGEINSQTLGWNKPVLKMKLGAPPTSPAFPFLSLTPRRINSIPFKLEIKEQLQQWVGSQGMHELCSSTHPCCLTSAPYPNQHQTFGKDEWRDLKETVWIYNDSPDKVLGQCKCRTFCFVDELSEPLASSPKYLSHWEYVPH